MPAKSLVRLVSHPALQAAPPGPQTAPATSPIAPDSPSTAHAALSTPPATISTACLQTQSENDATALNESMAIPSVNSIDMNTLAHSASVSTNETFRFLDLPIEMRNHVYEVYLPPIPEAYKPKDNLLQQQAPLALALANREISAELLMQQKIQFGNHKLVTFEMSWRDVIAFDGFEQWDISRAALEGIRNCRFRKGEHTVEDIEIDLILILEAMPRLITIEFETIENTTNGSVEETVIRVDRLSGEELVRRGRWLRISYIF